MKKAAKKTAKKVGKKVQPKAKVKVKDAAAEWKKEIARVKRESNARIRELESQVESIPALKASLEKKKKDLLGSKGLDSKVRELTGELENKENDLLSLGRQFRESEAATAQLRGETEYKNRQLASKNLEIENYKKAAEERILQLEAKVRELEEKIQSSSGTIS